MHHRAVATMPADEKTSPIQIVFQHSGYSEGNEFNPCNVQIMLQCRFYTADFAVYIALGVQSLSTMPITASVYIATSLDGFISRLDGNIDWLHEANSLVPPSEDCGYAKFMETVDVLVMGRNTYEQVITFDPWPYGSLEVIVLSTQQITVPAHAGTSVVASSETPAKLLGRLASQGARHVYVDGGRTIQSFLADGLIDRITVTVIPVLLGSGRPLFATAGREQKLELLSSTAYEFGFVQSTYRVLADA